MAYINCKKCGCQMSDKSEACPMCGQPVGDDVNNAPLNASQPPTQVPPAFSQQTSTKPQLKKANKTPLIIGIVAGVVVVALVAVLLLMKGKKNQEQQIIPVEQQLVEQKNEQQASDFKDDQHASVAYVVINATELRLRYGPSLDSDTFKWGDGTNRHPNKGERYRYLDEYGDFYKIDYKGNELWVSKQFTYIDEERAGQQPDYDYYEDEMEDEYSATQDPKVYSNAYDGFVNIRQSPSSKAPILGVLKNGPDGAVLLGSEGEWKKIDCNGIVGYVYEKYVQDTPTEVYEYWGLLRKDASNYRFTENDLSPLTAKELTYLRNSVYAKHGYVFNSQELNNYFKQISWYHPDASVTAAALNSVERANVEFIKRYQERNGKTYKPQ